MTKFKQALLAGVGLLLLCQTVLLLALGRGEAASKGSLENRVIVLEQAITVQQQTVAVQQQALAILQAKLAHVSVSTDGKDITVSGANLHIVNGLGTTDAKPTNGLGNLIIGYNESRAVFKEADERSGSHNLIIGSQNSFSSYGGLCVGNYNTLSAPFGSVSGGYENTVSAFAGSILGGAYNTASGREACVTGGLGNAATGALSAVGGGYNVSNTQDYGWSAGGNYSPDNGPGKFHWP